jgi:tetratricopeptide (TPR) repeat protein
LRHARKAISIYQESGDLSGETKALVIAADCLGALGRMREARVLAREAIGKGERSESAPSLCRALYRAGVLALRDGDHDQADLQLRRCIRLAESVDYRAMACEARVEQYALELARGRERAAARLAARLRSEISRIHLEAEVIERFRALERTGS